MKKQYQTLIWGVVGVTLLSGAWFCLRFLPEKEKPETNTVTSSAVDLIKIDKKEIKTIHIKNESADFQIDYIQEQDKDVYKISGIDEGEPVDDTATSRLWNSFANLRAQKTVAETSENLATYGLDSSKSKITIDFKDESSKSFLLGKAAPFNSGSYLQMEGDPKVYLISSSDAQAFSSSAENYLKKKEDSAENAEANTEDGKEEAASDDAQDDENSD